MESMISCAGKKGIIFIVLSLEASVECPVDLGSCFVALEGTMYLSIFGQQRNW